MKLSDAIRLGSKLHPQAFGDISIDLEGMTGTCALGAAIFAAECPIVMRVTRPINEQPRAGLPHSDVVALLPVEWNFIDDLVACPVCHTTASCTRTIAHLNDEHTWTREAIADWVATIEPPDYDIVDPVVALDAARGGAR